jgi:AcrR family transcriptional regulator
MKSRHECATGWVTAAIMTAGQTVSEEESSGTVVSPVARTRAARSLELRPKLPQRTRGKVRVAALLEAGSAVFVEKGFDRTTMTEIAERAGASIGSLYQFFPTKESLADMLRANFGNALCEELASLRKTVSRLPADDLATKLVAISINALARHPAFVALSVVRGRVDPGVSEVRERLTREFGALIATWAPHLTAEEARTAAVIVRQLLRIGTELAEEASEPKATNSLSDLRLVLSLYLAAKSQGGRGART